MSIKIRRIQKIGTYISVFIMNKRGEIKNNDTIHFSGVFALALQGLYHAFTKPFGLDQERRIYLNRLNV